jgi:uncharacterized protein YacL (UPF0231 family)
MKRTIRIFSILSLAFAMTVAAFGQTTSAQQTKPERFNKRQLNTLIATAKTSAEHQRIAQYYQAKAQDYLAQAKEHEQMVAAYKANPSLTAKSQASTINDCEYFVQTFKDLAVKSQELAQLHEQMTEEAEQK